MSILRPDSLMTPVVESREREIEKRGRRPVVLFDPPQAEFDSLLIDHQEGVILQRKLYLPTPWPSEKSQRGIALSQFIDPTMDTLSAPVVRKYSVFPSN